MADARVADDEDAAWIAAALVLAAALGGAVVLAELPLRGAAAEAPAEPSFVTPEEGGTELWPYTARERAFSARTLGINVVFYASPETVERALTERSGLSTDGEPTGEVEPNAPAPDERVEVDPDAGDIDDVIAWSEARGATRYTYFEVDGEGRWVDESNQLHDGRYLGYRVHVRTYHDPQGEWTAAQVHDEHWDWFRLRHTVTGIDTPQRSLETEFIGDPSTDRVVRMPFGNETADGDGWATGIYLVGALLVPLFGIARSGRGGGRRFGFVRRRRRELALGAGLFLVVTGVRWLGILGESLGVHPKVVAAPLYLCLVAGTPALAYRLGGGSDGVWAFTFAVLGFGGAVLVDFTGMGVAVVPLRVVLHRTAAAVAVGLTAYGAAIAASGGPRRPVVVGVVGWVVGVLAPLFGHV